MDTAQDKDLTIKSITAVPRSKNFYNFFINGTNEKRSMKLNGLSEFIMKLCPSVGGRATIMIYEFRPFYVEVETQTLLELAEIPDPPESRHTRMFGGIKKTVKRAESEKEQKSGLVAKRKQILFNSILGLTKEHRHS
jgi:hypothetical protein